jgi:hypothetical protein
MQTSRKTSGLADFVVAAAAIGVIAWCARGRAEEPAKPAPAATDKPADEAKSREHVLFDGETLKNWKVTPFGGEGEVEVKDGNLVIGAGQPLSGITWNGSKLPQVNYEITLEAQRVTGSDFFCGLTFPVQKDPCTLILGGWGGALTGLSSINRMDASENETTNFYKFENGKWYTVRVRVTERKIQAWLGDTALADVDYSDKKVGIRLEMELNKPLGVATYNTQAALRNFKVRELTEEERGGMKDDG